MTVVAMSYLEQLKLSADIAKFPGRQQHTQLGTAIIN